MQSQNFDSDSTFCSELEEALTEQANVPEPRKITILIEEETACSSSQTATESCSRGKKPTDSSDFPKSKRLKLDSSATYCSELEEALTQQANVPETRKSTILIEEETACSSTRMATESFSGGKKPTDSSDFSKSKRLKLDSNATYCSELEEALTQQANVPESRKNMILVEEETACSSTPTSTESSLSGKKPTDSSNFQRGTRLKLDDNKDISLEEGFQIMENFKRQFLIQLEELKSKVGEILKHYDDRCEITVVDNLDWNANELERNMKLLQLVSRYHTETDEEEDL